MPVYQCDATAAVLWSCCVLYIGWMVCWVKYVIWVLSSYMACIVLNIDEPRRGAATLPYSVVRHFSKRFGSPSYYKKQFVTTAHLPVAHTQPTPINRTKLWSSTAIFFVQRSLWGLFH